MFRSIKLTKEFILLGITGVITLGVIILAVTAFLSPSSPRQNQNPSISSSPKELTDKERLYPTGKSQPFKVDEDSYQLSDNTSITGSLVVTSDVPDVWVFIDPSPHGHSESESNEPEQGPAPDQYPPFTIDVPTGEHRLVAAKPDYESEDITFTIKRGEITRIHLNLKKVTN